MRTKFLIIGSVVVLVYVAHIIHWIAVHNRDIEVKCVNCGFPTGSDSLLCADCEERLQHLYYEEK